MLSLCFTAPVSTLVQLSDREPKRQKECMEKIEAFLDHFLRTYGQPGTETCVTDAAVIKDGGNGSGDVLWYGHRDFTGKQYGDRPCHWHAFWPCHRIRHRKKGECVDDSRKTPGKKSGGYRRKGKDI